MRCPSTVNGFRFALRAKLPAIRRCCHAGIVLLVIAAGLFAAPFVARGQDTGDGMDDLFTPVGDGPGLQFRTGHIAFPTFGRNTSITHAELFPYLLDDNQMYFADMRLFMTNYGQLGGNLGLGYRTRPWGGSNIFGASLWYDGDDSLDQFYQDIGISLEQYGDLFDLRFNGYLPVGQTESRLANRLTNPRFVGNNLLYDRVLIFGTALGGVDYEVGMPLPATVLRQHNLRAYVGAYHFAGNGVDMISGGKARIEGSIIPSVEAQVAVTSDSYFGTNVTLGVSWTYFGGFERTETNRALRYDRMGEFVYRNYNVIVGKRKSVTTGVQAINPATGLPFVIQHVGPGGNSSGAPDDPWATVAAAQAAGGDVIIVHAGTVLNENIVLQDGDIVIGQGTGVQNYLDVEGYGAVLIPDVLSGAAPILQGVAGNAVTMANNSVFAGFTINSPTGHGVFANGIHDAIVSNVKINGAGGDGIFVHNGTGTFYLNQVEIDDAVANGLHVSGGSADIHYTGKIDSSVGRSILIENTTDGLVNLAGTMVTEDGGDGVRIFNNDGDVILDDLNIKNSSGIGVEIRGGEGAVTLDNTKITDAVGTGLLIADREGNTLVNHGDIIGADGQFGVDVSDNDGETWFNELDVKSKNATAVFSRDSGRFSVLTGDIDAVGGAAFDLDGTELNMNYNKVSASGGTYGIRIVDADGVFAITGATALGSGGVIQDAGTGIYLKNVDMFGIVGVDLDDNNVGLEADNVERLALTNVRVTDSTSHALDLLNVDEFHSINSQYLNSGSLDAAIVYEVSEAGSRVISMNSNTINATVGDGMRIEGLAGAAGSSLNFSFQGNAVKTHAAFANAVTMDWNGVLLANAITNGIQTLGSNSVGFDFKTTGTSLVQIGVGGNVIQLDGAQSTAVQMNTGGPAEMVIGGNTITFNGSGSTGLDFTLAESADLSILTNSIVDKAGGGTGMLFRSLDGPSSIEIEQNVLDFQSTGALVDRGIIFQTITDTVTLKGTKSNSIFNATTPFFVPAGTTQGKININGVNLPQ